MLDKVAGKPFEGWMFVLSLFCLVSEDGRNEEKDRPDIPTMALDDPRHLRMIHNRQSSFDKPWVTYSERKMRTRKSVKNLARAE